MKVKLDLAMKFFDTGIFAKVTMQKLQNCQ